MFHKAIRDSIKTNKAYQELEKIKELTPSFKEELLSARLRVAKDKEYKIQLEFKLDEIIETLEIPSNLTNTYSKCEEFVEYINIELAERRKKLEA